MATLAQVFALSRIRRDFHAYKSGNRSACVCWPGRPEPVSVLPYLTYQGRASGLLKTDLPIGSQRTRIVRKHIEISQRNIQDGEDPAEKRDMRLLHEPGTVHSLAAQDVVNLHAVRSNVAQSDMADEAIFATGGQEEDACGIRQREVRQIASGLLARRREDREKSLHVRSPPTEESNDDSRLFGVAIGDRDEKPDNAGLAREDRKREFGPPRFEFGDNARLFGSWRHRWINARKPGSVRPPRRHPCASAACAGATT